MPSYTKTPTAVIPTGATVAVADMREWMQETVDNLTDIEADVTTLTGSDYLSDKPALVSDINSKLEIDTFTAYVEEAGAHFGELDAALSSEPNATVFFDWHRPGEWAAWWTHEVPVGDPRTWAEISDAAIAVGDEGAEVRVTGENSVARRSVFAVEPGRIYRVRAAAIRPVMRSKSRLPNSIWARGSSRI
jgi:hypothetical protein